MKYDEAAQLIEAILHSLRSNPGQFHIHYNVVTAGAVGIGGAGGAGIVGIANGPGIGVYASASAPSAMHMQKVETAANAEMNKQFAAIQGALHAIIEDLRAQNESSAKRDSLISQLKTSWLPNVVVTMVAAILERLSRS